jgi:acetyltransferase (GNAT) family protein
VTAEPVAYSAIDTERFGVRTARAVAGRLEEWPRILSFCRQESIRLLIVRCATADIAIAQAIEDAGGRLMDTLLTYRADLAGADGIAATLRPDDHISVAPSRRQPGEQERIRKIAAEAFQSYLGHYHADTRLDQARCDAAYASWAANLLESRALADEILVAELDTVVCGFAALKRRDAENVEGILVGVAPWARRRGVLNSIIAAALGWSATAGARHFSVATLITNLPVQQQVVRFGFVPVHSTYTFHVWFDERAGLAGP